MATTHPYYLRPVSEREQATSYAYGAVGEAFHQEVSPLMSASTEILGLIVWGASVFLVSRGLRLLYDWIRRQLRKDSEP